MKKPSLAEVKKALRIIADAERYVVEYATRKGLPISYAHVVRGGMPNSVRVSIQGGHSPFGCASNKYFLDRNGRRTMSSDSSFYDGIEKVIDEAATALKAKKSK